MHFSHLHSFVAQLQRNFLPCQRSPQRPVTFVTAKNLTLPQFGQKTSKIYGQAKPPYQFLLAKLRCFTFSLQALPFTTKLSPHPQDCNVIRNRPSKRGLFVISKYFYGSRSFPAGPSRRFYLPRHLASLRGSPLTTEKTTNYLISHRTLYPNSKSCDISRRSIWD